jgi:hypothetical protein
MLFLKPTNWKDFWIKLFFSSVLILLIIGKSLPMILITKLKKKKGKKKEKEKTLGTVDRNS